MAKETKRTEAEWRTVMDLRAHWSRFCDAEPFDGSDTFIERMKAAGFARLRQVTRSDVENDPFAAERGIRLGGQLWELTAKGLKAIEHDHSNPTA